MTPSPEKDMTTSHKKGETTEDITIHPVQIQTPEEAFPGIVFAEGDKPEAVFIFPMTKIDQDPAAVPQRKPKSHLSYLLEVCQKFPDLTTIDQDTRNRLETEYQTTFDFTKQTPEITIRQKKRTLKILVKGNINIQRKTLLAFLALSEDAQNLCVQRVNDKGKATLGKAGKSTDGKRIFMDGRGIKIEKTFQTNTFIIQNVQNTEISPHIDFYYMERDLEQVE
jgi:hypothetical protein